MSSVTTVWPFAFIVIHYFLHKEVMLKVMTAIYYSSLSYIYFFALIIFMLSKTATKKNMLSMMLFKRPLIILLDGPTHNEVIKYYKIIFYRVQL